MAALNRIVSTVHRDSVTGINRCANLPAVVYYNVLRVYVRRAYHEINY